MREDRRPTLIPRGKRGSTAALAVFNASHRAHYHEASFRRSRPGGCTVRATTSLPVSLYAATPTWSIPVKQFAIITIAACSLVAGCASYTERVVEKPAPARPVERTVVYDTTPGAQTTTVYTTR